jgi:hypothetical protein
LGAVPVDKFFLTVIFAAIFPFADSIFTPRILQPTISFYEFRKHSYNSSFLSLEPLILAYLLVMLIGE